MKRLVLTFAAIAASFALVFTFGLAAQEPASPEKPASRYDKLVQRFIPDSRPQPWQPDRRPSRERVVYAEALVLEGPNCRITLNAAGTTPGITCENRQGQKFLVYFGADGQPVCGLLAPGRDQLSAGLFTHQGRGFLQVADREGIHVLDGAELGRGSPARPWGKIGSAPDQK